MTTLIGLYRPGGSVMHRVPAGHKLAGLLIAGAGSILIQTPIQASAVLIAVLLGYLVARISLRLLWASVLSLLWLVIPLGMFQVLVVGWTRASVLVGVIVALVLLANLVTLTTRTTDLVDVVVRIAQRLTFLGVDPERTGLMLNLGIRSVPLILELASGIRDAQHARGQAASAHAFAVPLLVGALRRAEEIGDALAARGLDD